MPLIDAEKLIDEEKLVDRATEKLVPALQKAIKEVFDGLTVDITIHVRQKGGTPIS